jgi:hypothetical protein
VRKKGEKTEKIVFLEQDPLSILRKGKSKEETGPVVFICGRAFFGPRTVPQEWQKRA